MMDVCVIGGLDVWLTMSIHTQPHICDMIQEDKKLYFAEPVNREQNPHYYNVRHLHRHW